MDTAQDRKQEQILVNIIINFLVSKKAGNFLTITSSRRTLLH
jgi:hypothetical protein